MTEQKEEQQQLMFGVAVEVSIHLYSKIYELMNKYQDTETKAIPISEIKAILKEGMIEALSTDDVYNKIRGLK